MIKLSSRLSRRRKAAQSKSHYKNVEFLKRMARRHRGWYMAPVKGILFARAHKGTHMFHH